MAKYIHKFKTESEFNAVYGKDGYSEPWISLTKNKDEAMKIRIVEAEGEEPIEVDVTYIIYQPEDNIYAWVDSNYAIHSVIQSLNTGTNPEIGDYTSITVDNRVYYWDDSGSPGFYGWIGIDFESGITYGMVFTASETPVVGVDYASGFLFVDDEGNPPFIFATDVRNPVVGEVYNEFLVEEILESEEEEVNSVAYNIPFELPFEFGHYNNHWQYVEDTAVTFINKTSCNELWGIIFNAIYNGYTPTDPYGGYIILRSHFMDGESEETSNFLGACELNLLPSDFSKTPEELIGMMMENYRSYKVVGGEPVEIEFVPFFDLESGKLNKTYRGCNFKIYDNTPPRPS